MAVIAKIQSLLIVNRLKMFLVNHKVQTKGNTRTCDFLYALPPTGLTSYKKNRQIIEEFN